MRSNPLISTACLLGILATAAASAQTPPAANRPAPPAMQASGARSPAGLPPGATSGTGNKAATPDRSASGAMGAASIPVDPRTGSTPGLPPGAMSTSGNKAATPPSAPASGAR